jgi:DNA-binding transcriptional ArsR family regulator
MSKALHLDDLQLRKAALNYRAVNNKLRQTILRFIHKEGRVTVTPVYQKLKLEQSVASQHLAILRKAKIVATEREGRFIFYSINYQWLQQLHDIADSLQVQTKVTRP